MTISDVRKKLESKEISCAELTAECNAAAERQNKILNAFITLTPETAEASAKLADTKQNPLTGVPFALKDNFMTEGILTTCGSRMMYNYVPYFNAAVWETLHGLNAPLIGKANMDEFAMGGTGETSYYGAVKNPHNTKFTAGGSSGGVTAAVAAGLVPYGIGSDTGGSIRVPAAFCGVYGFRPTYGTISRHGLAAHASSLDQAGITASRVSDIAVVFDALSSRDSRDMTCVGSPPVADKLTGVIKGKKFGVIREFLNGLPENAVENYNQTLKVFKKIGAEFVDITIPYLEYALPAYTVISCAEASSNMGRFDGLRFGYAADSYTDIDDFMTKSRTEAFGAEVRRRILFGTYALSAGQYVDYFEKASKIALAIKNAFTAAFDGIDAVITPVTPFSAPEIGSETDNNSAARTDAFTVPASLAGLPALSVPCGVDGSGLPAGVQIIGGAFADAEVLNAALAFEAETCATFIKIAEGGVKL